VSHNQKTPLISMEVSHSQPQTAKNGSYHEPVLPVVKKAPMPIKTKPPNPTTPAQSMRNKNVNFSSNGEDEKKREKYLTAKYGAHQMALIRKRLKVEMWIFDQLQELYETETELPNDVDIDLDEILDIEDENQRKKFIRGILNNSKSSKEIINKFIDDLLEQAKTLWFLWKKSAIHMRQNDEEFSLLVIYSKKFMKLKQSDDILCKF